MTKLTSAKECRDCKVTKPYTEFYFRKRTGKLGTYCKDCNRKRGYKNQGYTPKVARVDRPHVIDGAKECLKCKVTQPLTEYYFLKNENHLAWSCKGCYKAMRIEREERTKYVCHRCKEQVIPEGKEG